MRANGICGAKRRGKPWRTTKPDPAARRRPDLVDRDFTAAGPDRLWVADITYLRCWEGVVFFAFVIDAYSRRIVGWQLAVAHAHHARPRRAADGAAPARRRRRRRAGPSLRSRQRNTPRSTTPRRWPITASSPRVGSVGDAYDNALAESFVDSFKTELIADRVWRTRSQLELAVVEYLGWFNSARIHQALGDLPPAEFEALAAATRDETTTPTRMQLETT